MNRSSFLSTLVSFVLCGPTFAYAQSIVDCVYPAHVAVSRVKGQVLDSFGIAVRGANVALVNDKGSLLQTTTDALGRFRITAPPGEYSFKATFPIFQTSQTTLDVGKDLAGLIHPTKLHVILGMAGSFCAWVTTSQKEFRNIINENKKRTEEAAQRNAT